MALFESSSPDVARDDEATSLIAQLLGAANRESSEAYGAVGTELVQDLGRFVWPLLLSGAGGVSSIVVEPPRPMVQNDGSRKPVVREEHVSRDLEIVRCASLSHPDLNLYRISRNPHAVRSFNLHLQT